MLVLQVFLFKDGQFLGNEMATGERLEIGRDPTCDVVLDEESISRRHAMLFEHEGKLAIQDAGSHLGTLVNGQPISTPRYIGSRDDVAIGSYTLKFKPVQQAASSPAAPSFEAPPPTAHVGSVQPPASAPAAPSAAPPEPARPAPVDTSDEDTIVDPFADLDSALDDAFPEAGKPTLVNPRPMAGSAPGPSLVSEPSQPSQPSAPSPPAPVEPPPAQAAQAQQEAPFEGGDALPPTAAMDPAVADTLVRQASDAALQAPDLGEPDGAAPIPTVEWQPGVGLVDEDEEDEDDLEPDWSIVQALIQARDLPEDKKQPTVVEVIHYRGDRILDHSELAEGDRFDFGRIWTKEGLQEAGVGKTLPLVKHKKGGVAELIVTPELDGRLLREGQQVELKSLPEAQGGKGKIPITQGDMASLELHGDRIFVRLGQVPSTAPSAEMVEADKKQRKLTFTAFGIAIGIWLMLFAVAWIAQYRALSETVIQLEDDGFAEVIEPELELEEPEPEIEEPKIEEELPPPKEEKTAKKPDPAPPAPKKDAPKKPGVLDALKNMPKAKAGNQSLTKALSNVKGIRVPGSSSAFKVSQMTGKGPKGVQIGGASGGVDTNSLNSIIRKGGGAGNLATKKSRKVKGRVKTLKRASKLKGQGILSKEQIQRVINKNVGKIQYCYEKQLRLQPGLSGKVVLEWTIGRDGRVKVVKSNRSTLKSSAAINCMIRSLKGWRFPKPKGNGTVIVKYPFIFNTL